MERIAEPELMLDREQAHAYAFANFAEPHNRFIDLLSSRLADLPPAGVALDLGAGPGDVARRLARAFSGWTVDAVDGSPAMLEIGRRLTHEAGLASRVQFHEILLPADAMPRASYALVFSNSLLHHLRDPAVLWSSIQRWAEPGAGVFVMDLLRPEDPRRARELVDQHAAAEPPTLQNDFYASLLAAYRPEEVADQLERAGLGRLNIDVVTDRHFIVWGQMPPPERVA
jgi:SAM-dependent methyltransferase